MYLDAAMTFGEASENTEYCGVYFYSKAEICPLSNVLLGMPNDKLLVRNVLNGKHIRPHAYTVSFCFDLSKRYTTCA